MKKLSYLFVLFFFLGSVLSAATLVGVTMPNTKLVQGQKLVLNGLGIREATIFDVDVYVAGLYLQKKSSSGSAILNSKGVKQIAMKFVRNVDMDDLQDAWVDGFKKNAPGKYNFYKARIKKLNSWMCKMLVGQKMAFTFSDKGVTVQVKGSKKGFIQGSGFSRVMLAIWLGSSPPNKGLKRGMLGRK